MSSVRVHHTVTVYTRLGCHLCDEAIAVVRLVADGRAEVQLVDIDADPALTERYTIRVPVVAVDGVEIAQYQIAPEQLEAALGA
jgi:glutaredoxin